MGNISSVREGAEEGQGGSSHSQAGSEDLMGQSPPQSPRSAARQPILFTPQIPISPLPRHNGLHSPNNTWKPLQRSGKDFTIMVVLPSGFYQYRFIVDGESRYAPDVPWMNDGLGNVHNILDLKAFVPEELGGAADFEMPQSPESSYNNWPLGSEDLSKEPPLLPPHLHFTVLNTPQTSVEHFASSPPATAMARPPHVVLNHLYIQKGRSGQPAVALAKTHRFLSKYVTVILYKSVAR